MNRTFLHGNTGQDPEVKHLESGKVVAKFTLATSEKRGTGENRTNETTWHNIVEWGKTAELCEKYVKKGISLIIEGKIIYRTYEDKNGVTRYTTEIIANELHFTGSKKNERSEPERTKEDDFIPVDDDLPF